MNISTQSSPSKQPLVFVGLDVHKNSIVLAAKVQYQPGWLAEKTFGTEDLSRLSKFLKKLSKHGAVKCCYEASGSGFYLYRQLKNWNFDCAVIAPSLIPSKPGDTRKTDRIDARNLCQYFESGLLTEVSVPNAEREAVRGLVRCRQAIRDDVKRAKHQVSKLLQTKGLVYREGKKQWTDMHFGWLNRIKFDCSADTVTFQFYLSTLDSRMKRLEEADREIAKIAEQEPYRDAVRLLCGFRGVKTLTAMVLITELGDIRRFASPSHLMSYVGLTPSVSMSGESGNKAGAISKAGSARCRHVLVQAAWNCARRPTRSRELRKRQEGLPAWAVECSWKAQKRLYERFKHLDTTVGRRKSIVAVARELVGFLGYTLMRQANGGKEPV